MSYPVIPDIDIWQNTEQRSPLVLVLDRSASMRGEPIDALNTGLRALDADLRSDLVAMNRARLLVVDFGGVDEVGMTYWRDAVDFSPPLLEANGTTPMGEAVDAALAGLATETASLREAGIPHTIPLLLLMSDGHPNPGWERAAARCRAAEASGQVIVFPIAVGSAVDPSTLAQFSERGELAVKLLDGLKFVELLVWLSQSVRAVSMAKAGGLVQLPPTDTWALPER